MNIMHKASPAELADMPLSQDFVTHRDALMVPWGDNIPKASQRAGGLFTSEGSYIAQSKCLRNADMPVTVEPVFTADTPPEHLPGRYLYGGLLYAHFGHFLCESTARLWALPKIKNLDGVVWVPKPKRGHAARLTRGFQPFFDRLGFGDLKLMAPQENTRIDEVVFAEQGFGLSTLSAGRPEFRAFMRDRLTAGLERGGPDKIYVSRSSLPSKRGSVLSEPLIETLMAAEGYEIFHPQEHDIDTQISRYMNAKMIVGLDGSALHLAAMVARPDVKVAIINRGPSNSIDDYTRQFATFSGVDPIKVEAVSAYWFAEGQRVVIRETHASLDMPTVGRALFAAGMIASPSWSEADPDSIASEIAMREERSGQKMQRYEI